MSCRFFVWNNFLSFLKLIRFKNDFLLIYPVFDFLQIFVEISSWFATAEKIVSDLTADPH